MNRILITVLAMMAEASVLPAQTPKDTLRSHLLQDVEVKAASKPSP